MALNIKTCRDGIQFSAIIQPRSSKNKICGIQGESLKIRLTSPPVENAANKMCTKFLAKQLDIALSQITIVNGQKGRNKIIRIEKIEEYEFIAKILKSNKTSS
jgi:hypothetical protein